MFDKSLYANLILPLPLPGYFTYEVPSDLRNTIQKGVRVVVQFGKKKLYTALVKELHEIKPGIPVKSIISQMDAKPVVNPIQFSFWEWISTYYMCTPGEVMNAALPPSLKLSSETRLMLHPDFEGDYSNFNEREYRIVSALEQRKELSIADAAQVAGQLRIIPLVNSLIEKNAIQVFEEVLQRYKPKTEKYYRISKTYRNDDRALMAMLDYLEKRAPRQYEAMQVLIHSIGTLNQYDKGIPKSALQQESPNLDPALSALLEKGLIEVSEHKVSRLAKHEASKNVDEICLTEHQQEAFSQIKTHFLNHQHVLLHGVTSSGKTEIYIKLINEVLQQGRQVLYLLPEIALTTQIINRLRMYFGDVVGVYHSRHGEAERAEVWNRLASARSVFAGDDGQMPEQNPVQNPQKQESEKYASHSVILGARSSVFLPFSNLGLVIIDEEHDSSYKQYDPSPRYHARDAALFLAMQHKASVLLGSATPAIESYFNTKRGKFALVTLNKRYGDLMLPRVQVADIKEAGRLKQMKSHFSPLLLEAIELALAGNKQIILFQNRRGFSLRLECGICNFVLECRHCDVTLIYHKREKILRCHYCGYSEPLPLRCPKCQNPDLNLLGFGTEKVEEELSLLYPDISISRMDLDTTRSKHAYHRIISDFEEKRVDVLTGTQMVTKGLDFDNVILVGILNADNMVSFPDFRAFERSYQIMAQVSGRAGRKGKQGTVIIQTRNPQHPVIKLVMDNDYEKMYQLQIVERHRFNYPPFSRLVKISLKHKEPEPLGKAAAELARKLRNEFRGQILGPEFPMIPRIRNHYIKEILIKLRRDATLAQSKVKIGHIINEFLKTSMIKQLRVVTDVDPM